MRESIVNPSTAFLQQWTGWLGAAQTKNEFLKHNQPARPNLPGEMTENCRWFSQVHQYESSDDRIFMMVFGAIWAMVTFQMSASNGCVLPGPSGPKMLASDPFIDTAKV